MCTFFSTPLFSAGLQSKLITVQKLSLHSNGFRVLRLLWCLIHLNWLLSHSGCSSRRFKLLTLPWRLNPAKPCSVNSRNYLFFFVLKVMTYGYHSLLATLSAISAMAFIVQPRGCLPVPQSNEPPHKTHHLKLPPTIANSPGDRGLLWPSVNVVSKN